MLKKEPSRLTLVIIILGICVSVLSTMETRIDWIASLCGLLGNGCRETIEYTLLGAPIPFCGLGFFLLLLIVYFAKPSWLFFGMMAGVGVEIALLQTMIEIQSFCVLCALNAFLMLVLFVVHLDRKRFYEMATAILLFYIIASSSISRGNNIGSSTEDPSSVVATVGERQITLGELNQSLTTQLHQLEKAKHRMRQSHLELLVKDLLLEMEADEMGIGVKELKDSIRSQTPEPNNSLVDYYYVTKRYQQFGRWKGSKDEIKKKINAYLLKRDTEKQLTDHCQELRSRYPVTITLEEPPLPLTEINLEGHPSLGPANAPVTIIEFTDYQCPTCRSEHDVVLQIRKKYEGQIRWVFRDFPLNMHREAKELALAGRCADSQGKFWDYYDLLFSKERQPKAEETSMYAEELGLDVAEFNDCMVDSEFMNTLDRHIAEAKRAGITTTPSFIINDQLYAGMPSLEVFTAMIDEALKDAVEE